MGIADHASKNAEKEEKRKGKKGMKKKFLLLLLFSLRHEVHLPPFQVFFTIFASPSYLCQQVQELCGCVSEDISCPSISSVVAIDQSHLGLQYLTSGSERHPQGSLGQQTVHKVC